MNCHKHILNLIVLITVITWGGMAGVSLAADNRGHGAPADILPKELRNVDVKDYFLPGGTKESGVIQTAIGHVVVARGDLRQAYFAMNGDKLYEQDVVFTLKAAKCRIKLLNNDIITLGDRTRITIKEVTGEKNAAEKKTTLSMAQGKAMFFAIRTLSQKGTAMTVESPTSVAGVRGTKFGMEVTVEGEENNSAALPLLLADASEDWGRYLILAQAGPVGPRGPVGPNITTTVHGFDGTVTVTSTVDGRTQSVGAGQTVSATPQGMGSVMPTPPQVSQRFQAITNVPPPGGGSGSTSGSSQSSSSGSSSGNAPDQRQSSDRTGTANTNIPDTSNITQQQNVNQEEQQKEKAKDPVTDPKANASGSSTQRKGYGYFTALLTNTTDGTLAGEFVSQYRYDGDSNVWARGPNDADYVRVLGNSGVKGSATLKWVVFDSGNKNSEELNSSISSTTLGENDYMEWGYAIIGSPFTVDGKKYAFDNRAYWIFGGNIPSMVNLSGQVNYSGAAYGTYWSAAGGKNMTGTFKTDVNLTSGAISNFNLDVSGNGANAYIHSASGTIGSDAAFSITGGTWNLNGVTPDKTTAKGSLYGSSGTSMGGVWGMYSTAYNTSAAGIFAGTNKQMGHFAGMLEYASGGSYKDTYMTTSVQNFKSNNAYAMNYDDSYSTQLDGTGAGKNMVELGVKNYGQWTGSQPVTFSKLGANEYMEWGNWTQSNAMRISGYDFYFKNEGAYVSGSPTTDNEMATLKSNAITANYSGSAWGTYFVGNSAGTNLTGDFRGTVNFASQQVTDFNVNVSGGGNSVAIKGASGSFTGQTSTFVINTNSGTWQINNTTAANKGASGTVYGNGPDKGKYIGGVWQAGNSAGQSPNYTQQAVGGFQGSK